MKFRPLALAAIVCTLPFSAQAQSADDAPGLAVELNAVENVEGACRLTFLVENQTATAIDTANYQVVIFDSAGVFERFTLFGFRDLPSERPRVRQFDVRDITCENLGRVLINGLSGCTVSGVDSDICDKTPALHSRTEVELLG
ncbi:hypothetical protein RUE5091_03057 [Ruegeria denitrificans]|uniref:Tat pathway signal sequence domain protein n=1 Tax=Ruegeria denitrificans TaxID=1715692 RepID=A0A0P1IE91_9RHOB|nr:hypothetical protein [Ruegeria denitrificans]CUK08260.1 hypothetical protein RUE5091_03057 [Ruegeria denitrificans]